MSAKRCIGCMGIKQNSPVCELCGYDERTPNDPNQLPAGTMLQNQYIVGRVLGQGGFGITYIGWDRLLAIPVAIKEYYPSAFVTRNTTVSPAIYLRNEKYAEMFIRNRDRFAREAQSMARLGAGGEIPNIVRVQNLIQENNTAYIIMEYVNGIDLRQYLKKNGLLSLQETLRLLRPVMESLEKVHGHNIIHRDLSPDNIMVFPNGSVRLIDFGAAHEVQTDEMGYQRSTEVIVKHGFAPPEQYTRKGKMGPWTDVHAMSATVYYCMTGRVPPSATDRQFDGEEIHWDGLSPHVQAVLQRGMALRIEDRIQTMAELCGELSGEMPIPQQAYSGTIPLGDTTPDQSAVPGRNQSYTVPLSGSKQSAYAMELPKEKASAYTAPVEAVQPPRQAGAAEQPADNRQSDTRGHTSGGKIKWIALAAAAIVLAAAVFLFGRPRDLPVPEETEAPTIINTVPTEPVEIQMIAAQYSEHSFDWWADFARKFNAENPDINLVVDVVAWNDIYTVVASRVANEEQPDILNIDIFEPYQELLLPVEQWCSQQTYDKFYEPFLELSNVDGTVWALPDLATARAMYYNVDILEAAGVSIPSTWEELEAACRAIKAYNPNIYPWGVDMTTEEGQACFAYYAWNNGGGFVDGAGNWQLNSEQNIQATTFAVGLVKAGLTNGNPAIETRYQLQQMFADGQIAMMIGPNALSAYCEQYGNIRYGIAPIPTNDGAQAGTVAAMDRIMCFDNDYTEAELAAVSRVIDAFYEDETYARWIQMEGYLPVTGSAMELLAAENENLAEWNSVLESANFYPATKPEWPEVKMGVISVLQEALLGGNVRNLLDRLQAEVTG